MGTNTFVLCQHSDHQFKLSGQVISISYLPNAIVCAYNIDTTSKQNAFMSSILCKEWCFRCLDLILADYVANLCFLSHAYTNVLTTMHEL